MAWVTFGLPTLSLLLIQTVNDNYGEATVEVWAWALATLFPTLLLLLVHAALNRHAAKLLPRGLYTLLRWATVLYLVMVLFTLLAEPLATQGNTSMLEYFRRSYAWLLPIEIALLLLYVLVFFRKEPLFRPNPAAIRAFAENNAEKWAAQHPLRAQSYLLVAENKLPELFELLRSRLPEHDTRQTDLAMLQGEHTEWKRQLDLGLVASDDAQRRLNRIAVGLMSLVENI